MFDLDPPSEDMAWETTYAQDVNDTVMDDPDPEPAVAPIWQSPSASAEIEMDEPQVTANDSAKSEIKPIVVDGGEEELDMTLDSDSDMDMNSDDAAPNSNAKAKPNPETTTAAQGSSLAKAVVGVKGEGEAGTQDPKSNLSSTSMPQSSSTNVVCVPLSAAAKAEANARAVELNSMLETRAKLINSSAGNANTSINSTAKKVLPKFTKNKPTIQMQLTNKDSSEALLADEAFEGGQRPSWDVDNSEGGADHAVDAGGGQTSGSALNEANGNCADVDGEPEVDVDEEESEWDEVVIPPPDSQ